MKSECKIVAQGELEHGGWWYVKQTKINVFEWVVLWWKCKFGEYKDHYMEVRDKDGNRIVHPLNTDRRFKT